MPLSRGNAFLEVLDEVLFFHSSFGLHYLSDNHALQFTCLVNFNLCLRVTFCVSELCIPNVLECGLIWVVLLIATFKISEKAFSKASFFCTDLRASTVHQIFWRPCPLSCVLAQGLMEVVITGGKDKTKF